MTKQQEIEIINEAIAKLGADSYLGPWLVQIRHELDAYMRSDIFPMITLAEARAQCEDIIRESRANMETINRESEAIISKAQARARAVIEDAAGNLRVALHALT